MGFGAFGDLAGLGGSSNDAANLAAKNQAQQQFYIDQGTNSINAIFNGGTTSPLYSQAIAGQTPKAGQQYYKQQFKHGVWSYVPETARTIPGIGPKAGQLAGSNNYIMTPGQAQTGFNNQFYQNAQNAYVNYAMPQLGQQYKQAGDSLAFGYANRGLGQSTARQSAQNTLDTTYGQGQQNIVDTGINNANNLRTQVENSRETALNQLYQTANPGQSQQTALNLAQQVTAPSAYAPLGNAFSNILSSLAVQQAYNNTPQLGYYAPVSNFNANSGALPSNQ